MKTLQRLGYLILGVVIVCTVIGLGCGVIGDGDSEIYFVEDSPNSFHLQWDEPLVEQRIVLVRIAAGIPIGYNPFYLAVEGSDFIVDYSVPDLDTHAWKTRSQDGWREEPWYKPESVTRYTGIRPPLGAGWGNLLDAEGKTRGNWRTWRTTVNLHLYNSPWIVDKDYEWDAAGNVRRVNWVEVVTREDWSNDGGFLVQVNREGEVRVTDKAGNLQSGITREDLVVLVSPEEVHTEDVLILFLPGQFRSQELVFGREASVYNDPLSLHSDHPPAHWEIEILSANARSDIELPASARYANSLYKRETILAQHPFQPYKVGEPSTLDLSD